ncbi:MAG: hypothetical protein K2X46_15290, partial [Roseomonas sp.]|nr:hypothetical protein [Roseomonas sp.]
GNFLQKMEPWMVVGKRRLKDAQSNALLQNVEVAYQDRSTPRNSYLRTGVATRRKISLRDTT